MGHRSRGAALFLTLCLFLPCAALSDQIRQQLMVANRDYLKHYSEIEARGGRGLALDLVLRLRDDENALDDPPAGYTLSVWQQRVADVFSLDSGLLYDLISGAEPRLNGKSGLYEGVFRTKSDGTLQPYAIYIPQSYYRTPNPALVVLLHGRPQTETEILGAIYFRTLADATGTIVAAPYGRGLYDFGPPADEEVYELLDHISSSFHVGRKRTFLAGYSMGGFSVFSVGPLHGERWAAIMCIAGAILNSETDRVIHRLGGTPFYVVTGKQDESIPSEYGERTAAFLQSAGVPVSFYEEPAGHHWLNTLVPSLTQAWNDMLIGKRRASRLPAPARLPLLLQQQMSDRKIP